MMSPSLMICTFLVSLAVYIQGQFPASFNNNEDYSYDAVYDFRKYFFRKNDNVTVVNKLTGRGCSTRGILKIALASAETDPSRRRVSVDLFFQNPKNFVFNLGDSSYNQGSAGSESTQSHDAEVQGFGTTFSGNLSESDNHKQAFKIANLYKYHLNLIVGDGEAIWIPDNINKINYYYNSNFFALNGQADTKGPINDDLYLGVNQALTGTDRVGSGLCKVGIKFLPAYGY
jgi:hypothetical protein